MTFSKLALAVATVLGAGATSSAYAIDLYVDVKTKQIYAEPGPHRQLMGSFVKSDEAAAMAAGSKPAESTELAAVKEDLELKTNEIKALQEHMTEAEKVKVKMDTKGLQVESADKDFQFKLGGRIQADANYSGKDQYYENGAPVEANDGTEFRRARIDFVGVFFKDWNFKTVADFADNKVAMKDLFIEYTGLDFMNVTAGQQKQNFSRELLESSNDLMFTERSLMNVLNAPVVDRAIGLNLQSKAKKHWTAALGVYGNAIDPQRTTGTENNDAADEGWGVSGRGTFAPIDEKTQMLYVGVAGNYRQADSNGDVALSKNLKYVYETNHMSDLDLINKTVHSVKNITNLGLETGGIYGPFSFGAEYTRQWVDLNTGGNLEVDGWYADAAWTLTGESRKFKQGKFYKVSPSKPFNLKNGGWGAWELASRISNVDVNDGAFKGGEMSNVTVALNWYINDNLRFMADYIRSFNFTNAAVTSSPTGGDPDNNDTFTLRAQLAY